MKKLSLAILFSMAIVAVFAFSPKSTEAKVVDDAFCVTQPTSFKMSHRGIYDDSSDQVFFTAPVTCNAGGYHWTLSGNGQTYITSTNQFPAGLVGPADLGCGTSTVSLKVYLSNGTFTNTITQNVTVSCPLN